VGGNIILKQILKKYKSEVVHWSHLRRGAQWQVDMKMFIEMLVPLGNVFTRSATTIFSRRTQLHGASPLIFITFLSMIINVIIISNILSIVQ
jgi:hypothetical protein